MWTEANSSLFLALNSKPINLNARNISSVSMETVTEEEGFLERSWIILDATYTDIIKVN